MGITKRGAAWEWLHSWWMLFIFMPFAITSFFAFLFIGIKVRNKKWIMYGIIYFFIFAFGFVLPDLPGVFIVVPLWAVTIIHGFKVRPLYLIQLDVSTKIMWRRGLLPRQEVKPRADFMPRNSQFKIYIFAKNSKKKAQH
jgi:hypothetical protein